MKVLLCSQYHGPEGKVFASGICFPIGLAYVASMLRDHEVVVFDANIGENPLEELSRLLVDEEPDLVGISLRNIDLLNPPINEANYYGHFKSMIGLIKERAPHSKIIVGGTGFSLFSRMIMEENREIDYGVVSNAEATISNLLKNFDHPERVKNLLLRKGHGVVFTGKEEPTDFDLLPVPSRGLFDMRSYRETSFSMGVQSKRGCAFRCAYCPDPFLGNYCLQQRSPRKVVDEIEGLVNEYGVNSFFFVDSIFNYPLEHAREICGELKRRRLDVRWHAYFREDFLNSKFMKEATGSGCEIFEFHSDGACDKVLAMLNKGIRIRDIERTADLVRTVEDAKVGYNFFYDLPNYNAENLFALARLTARFASRCRDRLSYFALTRMRIFPHTPLYGIALRQGKISEETDLLSSVYYTSGSSKIQEKYVSFLDKLSFNLSKGVAGVLS
jgi:anaerobic magnesium-protoporphyrin IX monomethyl ester cyclase